MSLQTSSAVSVIQKLYAILSEKQRRAFVFLVFLTFIGSLTDLIGLSFVIPIIGLVLSKDFYNAMVQAAPSLSVFNTNQLLIASVSLFFVIVIAKNVFGLYINRKQVRFVSDVYISGSTNMLEKIYRRSLPELQKNTSNELLQKLYGQQINLSVNVVLPTIVIINEGIIFVLTSLIMLFYNWQLFLLTIAVLLPIMGYFYKKTKELVKEAGKERAGVMVKLHGIAHEMIFGFTDIKIAGTEHRFKSRFRNAIQDYSKGQQKMNFLSFIPTRIMELAIFLCIIAIMLYCVYVLKDLNNIVQTVSLFSVIAYRSVPSINRFVASLGSINSAIHIFDDPDQFYTPTPKTATETLPIFFNRSLRFDNVSFSYPEYDKHVLNHCNLEIKRGEKIGIIGKSGAGKSTLINNLLGFLEPTEGSICIDNVALNKDNIDAWWEILGYVRQDVFILNSTLMENIALGETEEEMDLYKLQRAIRLASLTELVDSWPQGMYTVLGERGFKISGGQKQRVAIARAIYKGAKVLVFDEATSSLDSQTEEEITNAIRELGKEDLTIIIIAHRFTSLKYCDKIYRLENGQVTESLSYAELLYAETRDHL